jgi:hypothetical protein
MKMGSIPSILPDEADHFFIYYSRRSSICGFGDKSPLAHILLPFEIFKRSQRLFSLDKGLE